MGNLLEKCAQVSKDETLKLNWIELSGKDGQYVAKLHFNGFSLAIFQNLSYYTDSERPYALLYDVNGSVEMKSFMDEDSLNIALEAYYNDHRMNSRTIREFSENV